MPIFRITAAFAMTQFNPFVGAILPSAQAQRQQSTERITQVRRTQEAQKNAATHGSDTFEHQVESADAVQESQQQEKKNSKDRRGTKKQASAPTPDSENPPHLDMKA
jgi:hypothetical protein